VVPVVTQRGDFDAPSVPDPRFRDQLAQDVFDAIHIAQCCDPDADPNCRKTFDALLPLIEARVQAAFLTPEEHARRDRHEQ